MKLIIAGSRGITDQLALARAVLNSGFGDDITEAVSGGARGVDRMGEDLALDAGLPVRRFKPDWDAHGKRAGILRNEEMGRYADALLAVWDGKSRGTKHMIDYMKSLGKPVYVWRVDLGKGEVL